MRHTRTCAGARRANEALLRQLRPRACPWRTLLRGMRGKGIMGMKSKVYFADMRTSHKESLPQKLTRLMERSGLGAIDMAGKYVAIKLHFGEPGNLAYLRPNYAKAVADYVRAHGGKPFLTDCNTLYIGGRRNALDHIESAYENGFTPFSTGCHIIIADGLKGTDEAVIHIGGEEVREAKIGRALADADIIISLSHFKGHMSTGFGGTIKNIGMGGGSRAGKMEQHSAGKPGIRKKLCICCEACAAVCAHDALSFDEGYAAIDEDRCVGCHRCLGVCPTDAVQTLWDADNAILNRRMVEYTMAVLKDKPSFHISLAIDISPNCDCEGNNDVPVVADVGMFASLDPVALDLACVRAVNAMPANPGSVLGGCAGEDHMDAIHPDTNWRVQIEHGVKMGLGSDDYELIEI